MKKITLLLLLSPLLSIGQWAQVGADIDGESSWNSTGYSVCLSNDGNIVVIGGHFNNQGSGYVKILQQNSGVWSQIGSNIVTEDGYYDYGHSVSLSNDGSVLAIGESLRNKTRIFKNISGAWVHDITIHGEGSGDKSGYSVCLSGDGTVIAISAILNDGYATEAGHVRVFKNISGTWTQIGSDIDGPQMSSRIGSSVSLSNDGSILAIGSDRHDSEGGLATGLAQVYKNNSGTWSQIGSDLIGSSYYQLGSSVSLNNDGSVLAIGSAGSDLNGNGIASNRGDVRVFENILDTWSLIGNPIQGEDEGDRFGHSISLSNDGKIVAIGAPYNECKGIGSGSSRIYQNLAGVWTQVGSDIDAEGEGDKSGYSVCLSGDGSVIAIGAPDNGVNDFGHVRVFRNAILSIQENTFGANLSVYPNPSYGSSKIQLGTNYSQVTVQVFNISGKQISTQKHMNINEIILDTQEYTTGVYIVKVESGTKNATIKLVVK